MGILETSKPDHKHATDMEEVKKHIHPVTRERYMEVVSTHSGHVDVNGAGASVDNGSCTGQFLAAANQHH